LNQYTSHLGVWSRTTATAGLAHYPGKSDTSAIDARRAAAAISCNATLTGYPWWRVVSPGATGRLWEAHPPQFSRQASPKAGTPSEKFA